MMNNPTYFVPVDFSESSYQAVQYATLLAKMFGGRIGLFHVTDTSEIIESDNPLLTIRSMDELTRQAIRKMRSVCEMITETWEIPVDYSVTIGDADGLTLEEIKKTAPDIIVLEKNKKGNGLLKKILLHVRIPVFVIPPDTVIKEPSRVTLTTDLGPVSMLTMEWPVSLARRTPDGLSLLGIRQEEGPPNGKEKKEWAEHIAKHFDINASFLAEQDRRSADAILERVRSTYTDLLCIVKRDLPGHTPVFAEDLPSQLALKSEIATLVITSPA